MSLAMFAAPFNDNIESMTNKSDNIIDKKRQSHNKTQKRYAKVGSNGFDVNKVNTVLEKLHNSTGDEDDEDEIGEGKSLFNPPPKPESSGVERTIPKEAMGNMSNATNDAMFRTLGRAPQPNYEGSDNLDLNDYRNYGDSKTADEYYKQVLPGYPQQKLVNSNPQNRSYYNRVNHNVTHDYTSGQDVLLQKLNYMISLLEDQQDEKTNNVTEEVILYSFLGIFIIFIADTFVRAGKYVR
jgi:hypothetical protein